jgi:hypothetical protein
MNNGEILHCLVVGPAQNGWAGFGPIKKKFKNSFKRIVIFPHIFLLNFA